MDLQRISLVMVYKGFPLYSSGYKGNPLRPSATEEDFRVPERMFPADLGPALYKKFLKKNSNPTAIFSDLSVPLRRKTTEYYRFW